MILSKPEHTRPETRIEISEQAVRHNVTVFARLTNSLNRICAVIKGDAYGHGIELMTEILLDAGITKFAVFQPEEALTVRKLVGPDAMILILGYAELDRWPALVEADIQCVLFDATRLASLHELIPEGQVAKCHLKVDTGMNRFGLMPGDVPDFVEQVVQYANIELTGVATHFANAWDLEDPSFTKHQIKVFESVESALTKQYGKIIYRHLANTAGVIAHSEAILSFARVGIGIYGYYPNRDLKEKFDHKLQLRPALSFYTALCSIKPLQKGDRAGYDLTFEAKRDTLVGLVPIGYSDGFPFSHSESGAFVLIRQRRVPLIGRVNMNALLLDVTDVPEVQVGDRVTILGRDGDRRITVWNWMDWGALHLYECLTKISSKIPRVVVD